MLTELVEKGDIKQATADAHPNLIIVGLVGSIDNDMFGTDMTIGADSALHRITEAVDAITCTASSHKRAFVVKVMGRNSGYLALMSALATSADWVLIPENPPAVKNWEELMVERLKQAGELDAGIVLLSWPKVHTIKKVPSSEAITSPMCLKKPSARKCASRF